MSRDEVEQIRMFPYLLDVVECLDPFVHSLPNIGPVFISAVLLCDKGSGRDCPPLSAWHLLVFGNTPLLLVQTEVYVNVVLFNCLLLHVLCGAFAPFYLSGEYLRSESAFFVKI